MEPDKRNPKQYAGKGKGKGTAEAGVKHGDEHIRDKPGCGESAGAIAQSDSGQDLLVHIPNNIVGADLPHHEKLIGILSFQSRNFVGGNVVDHLPVAVLEVGQVIVGVIGQIVLDLLHADVGGVIVVGVFHGGDHTVVIPGSDGVSTVLPSHVSLSRKRKEHFALHDNTLLKGVFKRAYEY